MDFANSNRAAKDRKGTFVIRGAPTTLQGYGIDKTRPFSVYTLHRPFNVSRCILFTIIYFI